MQRSTGRLPKTLAFDTISHHRAFLLLLLDHHDLLLTTCTQTQGVDAPKTGQTRPMTRKHVMHVRISCILTEL